MPPPAPGTYLHLLRILARIEIQVGRKLKRIFERGDIWKYCGIADLSREGTVC